MAELMLLQSRYCLLECHQRHSLVTVVVPQRIQIEVLILSLSLILRNQSPIQLLIPAERLLDGLHPDRIQATRRAIPRHVHDRQSASFSIMQRYLTMADTPEPVPCGTQGRIELGVVPGSCKHRFLNHVRHVSWWNNPLRDVTPQTLSMSVVKRLSSLRSPGDSHLATSIELTLMPLHHDP